MLIGRWRRPISISDRHGGLGNVPTEWAVSVYIRRVPGARYQYDWPAATNSPYHQIQYITLNSQRADHSKIGTLREENLQRPMHVLQTTVDA